MPADVPPKLMFAPPEAAILVLKRNIKAPEMLINASDAYTHDLACRILEKMHAAPYGTRPRQARGEPEPSKTRLGTLPGVPVAPPQAFGTVENARVRGWPCDK